MAEEKAKKPMNPFVREWIIPIAVLVAICLVCGLLLALCNDLLYISPEEKERRAIAKIYPDYKPDSTFDTTLDANYTDAKPYGVVTKVVKSTDGTFIVTAKGNGGYGGTVTVSIAYLADGTIYGWTIQGSDGETFIANITAKHMQTWFIGDHFSKVQTTAVANTNSGKGSGATLTENAISNAINAANYYCKNKLYETEASRARAAVVEMVEGAGQSGYSFLEVDDAAFRATVDTLTFYFEGTKDGAPDLAAYVFGEDDTRKIVVVNNTLSHSARQDASAVIAKSEGIADEMVAAAQSALYVEYKLQSTYADFVFDGYAELNSTLASNATYGTVNKIYKSTDGAVVYETTGTGGFSSGSITLNVVIKDGVIKALSVVSNVGQSFYESNVVPKWNDVIVPLFIDKPITTEFATVTPDSGAGKGTGATYTENAIINAVSMACYYAKNITE
ncbi:MAG: hypothetical protein J1F66_00655 [Clostridiales bacterium]|nr:hypothetical protein [Clostridiales bacterium]